jgi:predicted CopG family antitoxin
MHRREYTDMGSRNISVRDDVYRSLKAAKGEDESFSDVIDRLLAAEEGDHPLYDLEGILDDEEAAEAKRRMEQFRRSLDEDMDRYA